MNTKQRKSFSYLQERYRRLGFKVWYSGRGRFMLYHVSVDSVGTWFGLGLTTFKGRFMVEDIVSAINTYIEQTTESRRAKQ